MTREIFDPASTRRRSVGVRSPLVEAGLTKAEIREQSRAMGLPTWDKPAQACLSSRIPYGTPVTVEALARIAEAEEYLRSLGSRAASGAAPRRGRAHRGWALRTFVYCWMTRRGGEWSSGSGRLGIRM